MTQEQFDLNTVPKIREAITDSLRYYRGVHALHHSDDVRELVEHFVTNILARIPDARFDAETPSHD